MSLERAIGNLPESMVNRDFLRMEDLSKSEIISVLDLADKLKAERHHPMAHRLLQGRVLAMIFEKPSTRTRVSFEAGMAQMGGHAIFLSPTDTQLGRGEPIKDTARVLAGYCDVIMARVFKQETVDGLAAGADIPVINGLSDLQHPCQILGDLQAIRESLGRLEGLRVCFIGDGNNVCHSLMIGCAQFGLDFTVACPRDHSPSEQIVHLASEIASKSKATINICHDPREAAEGANVIYTDVWASMGQEAEAKKRQKAFQGYLVDDGLLKVAAANVKVMHCLPAHRGEEITDEVMEGPHSIIFPEAENRLHAQKSLILHVVGKARLSL